MIELGMNSTGKFAHIRDRHVTYCGEPATDAEVPAHPILCGRCKINALAEGAVTIEELAAVEARGSLGSIRAGVPMRGHAERSRGPLLRPRAEFREGV